MDDRVKAYGTLKFLVDKVAPGMGFLPLLQYLIASRQFAVSITIINWERVVGENLTAINNAC
jgi:hypothetical protein